MKRIFKIVFWRIFEKNFLDAYIRNSRPEVFCKKIVLKTFAKFTGKHLYQSFLFNKVDCFWDLIQYLKLFYLKRSFIKRQTRDTSSENEWKWVVLQVTTNDNEWYNNWQQWVIANNNKWQRMTRSGKKWSFWLIFLFFKWEKSLPLCTLKATL